jgi:3-polyprenyl-4-hydroxybenzoate decarboxylase
LLKIADYKLDNFELEFRCARMYRPIYFVALIASGSFKVDARAMHTPNMDKLSRMNVIILPVIPRFYH